jgi:carbamoyltransferase
LVDGQIIHAIEEERLNRVKYWSGWPRQAIESCLHDAGISIAEVDHVAIARDPRAHLLRKIAWVVRHPPSGEFLASRAENARAALDIRGRLAADYGVSPRSLSFKVHNIEHHVAHLASAYYSSPFDRATIVAVDGFGDFVSTSIAVGEAHRLNVKRRVFFPDSLGIFYTAMTQFLGFRRYGDEYKVMGLAAYGEPRYAKQIRRVLRVGEPFDLDLQFFRHQLAADFMTWFDQQPILPLLFAHPLEELLGATRKESDHELLGRWADIARSLQVVFEEAMWSVLRVAEGLAPDDRLCLAGGVALNSVFNGQIRHRSQFKEVFVQPAAHDGGAALGAAQYVEHNLLGRPPLRRRMNPYTGPQFSADVQRAALERAGVRYEQLEGDELVVRAAALLDAGAVVGWYQDRMEWGPRALGNRSILADPRRRDARELLNKKIKLREWFRPFAPAVIEERCGEFFDDDYPEPYMVKVYGVRPHQRERIPAVTHVDGTARVQTVGRLDNDRFYRLLEAFEERTGLPILLNTSFNENEPIVCRPAEAIDCFVRTSMDALVIGDFLVRRQVSA